MHFGRSSFKIVFCALLCVSLFGFAAPLAASIYRSEDPERLMFKIYLPLEVGAQAKILFPDGREEEIGRVLASPKGGKHPGFTASKYGIGGQIIATAANTHHIQISVEDGAGRTMSIIPMRTYVAASGSDSSFVIEGEGGIGLWGRYAPHVGSPVYIINKIGVPILFENEQLFKFATAVEIRVYEPEGAPEFLEVENRPQGRIWYRDETGDHDFGIVEQSVSATGRFEGTVYEGRGMVRANHPGVICISTSERGRVGGFQIVPRSHTFSQELQKTRRMTQYIVVRGMEFEDLTGEWPFFRGVVRPGDESVPGYTTGLVLCLIDGEWQEMPDISGLTENTLGHVEAFRIHLR